MLRSIGHHRVGDVTMLAAVCFGIGVFAGALVVPERSSAIAMPPAVPPAALRSGHPAEVLRVIDGDTFEARVAIWPGMQVTTRVRLRGIDAAEMRADCAAELTKAHAARDALTQMLRQGSVGINNIAQDKYGGRVDADVSTARTADVAAALIERGVVRRYERGKRERWCG